MPQPYLDQATLKSLLIYDPDTGDFTWRDRPNSPAWSAKYANEKAGCVHRPGPRTRPYYTIGIFNWPWPAHRLAWLYMTGRWPKEIDHIDCNSLNNQWSNLREATRSQNQANKPSIPGRLKGAHFHKTKRIWRSNIKHHGRQYHLGEFATAQEAHEAYRQAAQDMFGEFARF